MLKVSVETTVVDEKRGTSAKTGKAYAIREQEAWMYGYDREGKPHPHPQKVKLTLDDDQQPYPLGNYVLCPSRSTLIASARSAFAPAFVPLSSKRRLPDRVAAGMIKRNSAVAVLFARSNSVYKSFSDCDVFDLARDARSYSGSLPVIAHPPCRGWGRLRHLAKPRPDEKDLALFAVEQVRRCGGVLEHPHASTLWEHVDLPRPGHVDRFGGFTFGVLQGDFGHAAPKATWLYICGLFPSVTVSAGTGQL